MTFYRRMQMKLANALGSIPQDMPEPKNLMERLDRASMTEYKAIRSTQGRDFIESPKR